MIGGCEGGKDCVLQSPMVLCSYEEAFQEDILHFIISHKWKVFFLFHLLSGRAHSYNSDFE